MKLRTCAKCDQPVYAEGQRYCREHKNEAVRKSRGKLRAELQAFRVFKSAIKPDNSA